MTKTVLRAAQASVVAIAALLTSAPAMAVPVLQGQSVRIVFQATTGTPVYDYVTYALNFSASNPFGTNETLSYQAFNSSNVLLSSGTTASGSSIYTSGLLGQLTGTAVPIFSGTTLTTNSFSLVLTAVSGSFDLTSATASFQHILTSGTNQLGVVGTITAPAVPEPATWGLMILGFGGVGYALRRRRATVTLAAA